MVEVLKTGRGLTPLQALLEAQSTHEIMDHCLVIWRNKDEEVPRILHSAIKPIEMNFFATALYEHSMKEMRS